ncbi:hypothetical protein HOY82DRAFT_537032 [Tuber indicum]|nr:hypothetical protein HOY82DRAFT_537032 [Tuber indicum]
MEEKLEEIEVAEERLVSEGKGLVGSMVGRRRVAVTWAVGEAWDIFTREKAEVIRNSFRVVGLSLPIDGSEDTKLSIKGLAKDFLIEGIKGWENDGTETGDVEVDFEEDFDEEINFVYE